VFRTALALAALLTAVLPVRLVQAAAAEQDRPPTREEIQALIEQIAEDDFSGMVASRKLAEIGQPALRQLIEATGHRVPRVRYWAISALSSIGNDQAVPAIMRLLEDPNALVRSVAVWHLGRWFDDPRVRTAVAARLKDENPSVRGWALRLIQTRNATDLTEQVRAVFSEDEDPEVRYDALTALAALAGADSLDVLIEVLRKEEDSVLREGAVRCCTLVSPPTPATGDVLIRALRDSDEGVRDVAATLLRKGFNQYFAFDPKAPAAERNKAIRQWREWYEANKTNLKWDEEKRRFELVTPPTGPNGPADERDP
jgi:HEAT repeat protein